MRLSAWPSSTRYRPSASPTSCSVAGHSPVTPTVAQSLACPLSVCRFTSRRGQAARRSRGPSRSATFASWAKSLSAWSSCRSARLNRGPSSPHSRARTVLPRCTSSTTSDRYSESPKKCRPSRWRHWSTPCVSAWPPHGARRRSSSKPTPSAVNRRSRLKCSPVTRHCWLCSTTGSRPSRTFGS